MLVFELLQEELLGNPAWRWLLMPLIIALIMIGVRVGHSIVARWAHRKSVSSPWEIRTAIAHIIGQTRPFLISMAALYPGTLILILPPAVSQVVHTVAVVSTLLQIGLWVSASLEHLIWSYLRREGDEQQASQSAVAALSFVGRIILWAFMILLIMDNIPGIQVTSLIAGLGITGVAVALAVKDILGDLLSSLSIVLDRPFGVGDVIAVGDFTGTVEHVGLKTTRLRSITGEQIIFGNADLLNSRIRNFRRMDERMVQFQLGVTYDTSPDSLASIPDIVQEIVEAQEMARFGRCHFLSYGESALTIEIVYHILSPDYDVYMDTRQAINLEIFQQFTENGIAFAYPTRMVYTHALPS